MKNYISYASIFAILAITACSGSDPIHNDIACVQKKSDGGPVICDEEIGKDFSNANCIDKLAPADRADAWTASAETSCPNGSKYDCDIKDSLGVTKHTYFYGDLGGVRGVIACAIENATN